jgi:hypothetical protein
MARRKRGSAVRVSIAIIVAIALALAVWQRQRLLDLFGSLSARQGAGNTAVGQIDPKYDGERVRVSGPLEIARSPRDAQLGIEAQAAILFRDVEMFEWHETCAGEDCRYELGWTAQPIDSRKFHHAAGHENPAAPFASARFDASDIRLGVRAIDAGLVAAQAGAVALPVGASDLPLNLAASFRAVDGALYAGGDPAHPQAGTLRVHYRIVPLSPVSLSGIQHGSRLGLR